MIILYTRINIYVLTFLSFNSLIIDYTGIYDERVYNNSI